MRRVTLMDGRKITVPQDYIERTMKSLGVTEDEAVDIYLDDEGYTVNEAVVELTAKAKAAGTTAKNQADKPKRKAPTRKPDEDKRVLVAILAECMRRTMVNENLVDTVAITNVERMIAFDYHGDKYEITLTKKRKPKE